MLRSSPNLAQNRYQQNPKKIELTLGNETENLGSELDLHGWERQGNEASDADLGGLGYTEWRGLVVELKSRTVEVVGWADRFRRTVVTEWSRGSVKLGWWSSISWVADGGGRRRGSGFGRLVAGLGGDRVGENWWGFYFLRKNKVK